jgi:hypothetical protein
MADLLPRTATRWAAASMPVALPRNVRIAPPVDVTPAPVSVAVGDQDNPERRVVVPASRPRARRRLVLGGVALALVGALGAGSLAGTLLARATAASASSEAKLEAVASRDLGFVVESPAADPAPVERSAEVRVASVPVAADARLEREGYGHIPGGVVYTPSTFASADGAYDLYVHFHGNAHVVLESAEHAGLNAIVAVVNLGVNSAPYLDAYDAPQSFERTLAAIDHAVSERGLDGAHRRRLAIGSWSGGYGAVSRVLDREPAGVDAVLVLDGIHCGFAPENKKALNSLVISPFVTGARRAARGEILFSITHSEIDPVTYAGSNQTAAYLLDAVHGNAGEPTSQPEFVELKSAEGAVARKLEKHMEAFSEATVGSFHVRGFRGNTPEHHMAHLFQMGATVLPELVARWSKP